MPCSGSSSSCSARRAWGALGAASAQTAPPFQDVRFAGGLNQPTAMALASDGRIFVTEQGGALRVVKDGALLTAPFLTVPVVSSNERGLLGVTFDPSFASNGFVYVYYTANTNPIVNRVSRFTVSATDPDRANPASETIIVNDIPSENGYHNGGALHFGADGKLYVAVGESHNGSNAQSLTSLAGKILRFNANGTVPTDNPFYASTTGNSRAIWALGLRNPFTFDIQPGTGRIFVNDVGQSTWEEIDEAWIGPNDGSNAGFNFGWPSTEGPTTNPSYHAPFHAYTHSDGCAITGGAFYNPTAAELPTRVRRRLLLRRLLRRLGQEHRSLDEDGVDTHRPRRRRPARRHQGRSRREPLLPGSRTRPHRERAQGHGSISRSSRP